MRLSQAKQFQRNINLSVKAEFRDRSTSDDLCPGGSKVLETPLGGYAFVSTQWAFGDGTSGDGSQLIHTYTASGNYTVCMTITGIVPGTGDTCQVEICQNIEVSVGVEDLTGALPITAWPQPFDGAVQLEGESLRGNMRYTLFDMTGRVMSDRTVLSQGRVALDYSGLPAGTYLLRLRNAHWDRSLRVTKR